MTAVEFFFLAAAVGAAFGVAAVVDRLLARAGYPRSDGTRADKW